MTVSCGSGTDRGIMSHAKYAHCSSIEIAAAETRNAMVGAVATHAVKSLALALLLDALLIEAGEV